MPWTYTIDPERSVITVLATGVLTDDELLTGLATATADPQFRSDLRFLVDYHEVSLLKLSAATMMKAAAYPAFSSKMRRAFIVRPGFFSSALNFAKDSAIGAFEVFNDRAEALAWLNEGVPPEKHITSGNLP